MKGQWTEKCSSNSGKKMWQQTQVIHKGNKQQQKKKGKKVSIYEK